MEQEQINSLYQVAEVELHYKSHVRPEDRIKVNTSFIAYEIFKRTWDSNRIELLEQFKMLMLDRRKNCLGISEIATGGMGYCLVDMKVIFGTALKAKAAGLIFAHNHPTGNLMPSKRDIELTNLLIASGEILDIEVHDHLIMAPYDYSSMADKGYIP